ncbi:MAG: amidohydrolase family protein [Bacteroidales bacterium]|nr:amidohydrolase family protein [Candidatus Cryptobacteroides caccocaballi]
MSAVALACCLSACSSQKDHADMVVYGKVFTSESEELAEAFAVKDGKYVFVGDSLGVQEYIGENTEIIDHTGKGMIMAGCTEGHGHYLIANFMRNSKSTVFLSPKDGSRDILEKVAQKVSESEPTYVFGFGWSFTELDKHHDFPTKEQIDAIIDNVPVYLSDQEGHKGLVNSYCLNHSGILDENGKVRDDFKYKSFVEVDKDGYPTGLLREQAGTYVRSHACVPDDDDSIWFKAIEDTQYLMNSMGYTSAFEAWGNQMGTYLFEAANKMDAEGRMTYNLSLSYEIENITPEETERGIQGAVDAMKYSSKHVNANVLKMFEDGTCETGSGYNMVPAADGSNGRAIWSPEELSEITVKANRAGLTVHVHTMGDGAIHNVMDAYEYAYNVNQKEHFSAEPVRNQMVHMRTVAPEDFDRLAKCNIVCVSGIHWHWMNESTLAYFKSSNAMNEKYFNEAYPYQSFLDHGIHTTIHTDAPASSGSPKDPFGIMQIACTGVLVNDEVNCPVPFDTKECVRNRADFLRSLTIEGAYETYREKERGSILPGKYADFIIIDKDVLTCDVNDIHETKVLKTFFEGKCVYEL